MTPTFGHTPHIDKQIIEPAIASFISNIVSKINYKSIGPQNGLILHEHVVQGFQDVLSKTNLSTLINPFTPIGGNYLPTQII